MVTVAGTHHGLLVAETNFTLSEGEERVGCRDRSPGNPGAREVKGGKPGQRGEVGEEYVQDSAGTDLKPLSTTHQHGGLRGVPSVPWDVQEGFWGLLKIQGTLVQLNSTLYF